MNIKNNSEDHMPKAYFKMSLIGLSLALVPIVAKAADSLNAPPPCCETVTVTITTEPTPPLAKPPPSSLASTVTPSVDNDVGLVTYGGIGGARVGTSPPANVVPNVHTWILNVAGVESSCCAQVRVGLIQNQISDNTTYTYSGGGTVTFQHLNPGTQTPATFPLLDGDLVNMPFYGPDAWKQAAACGELKLKYSDFPSGSVQMNQGGQALRSITSEQKFRIWIVKECPTAQNRITIKYYDWQVNFNYHFSGGLDGAPLTLDPNGTGTGADGGAGAAPPAGDPNPNPQVGLPLSSNGTPVLNGF